MRTYKRYHITLRFERGQPLPQAGDSFDTRTEFGRVPVRVRILRVVRTWQHEDDGATLMYAHISRSEIR